MANPSTLRRILDATSVPGPIIDELLGEAGATWLMGASDEVVAAEAVLCHPCLAPREVRAIANPTGREGEHRLTVVAIDRPGLLADTAGVLAGEGLSVLDAMTIVLPASHLALQRVAVTGGALDEDGWQRLGLRLRDVLGGGGEVPLSPWRPEPPVTVETQPQQAGRVVVTVRAPDRPGLLHAIASWLTGAGCNIESCHASTSGGIATDVVMVSGDVDPSALASSLGGGRARDGHGGLWPARVVVGTTVGLALLPWRITKAVWGLADLHR